ncbi:MAG: response regulator [Thiomargarita sp.]|nr:response regulator [Thiomargarita sp.]
MIDKPLVLIIDDSQVNIILLQSILEQQGFQVKCAKNGEEGLALTKQFLPNIILLDIVMIGWDGYETCRRIKQESKLAKIPILFLSALDDTENKVQAFQSGAVDYVNKPFQKEELLARVRTHLELAYLRQNLECEVVNQTEKIQLLFEALQLSYDKSQQASILKTEFLRNISHEFRTPMNIVLGMTEMLIEDTQLTEEQYGYAKASTVAGKKLMDILTNMLNFSQQFKGELKQVVSEFRIENVIKKVLKNVSFDVEKKGLKITTCIEPELDANLRGNKEGIFNVLNKLTDNAVKFTEKGEIVISAQLVEAIDAEWLQIEVQDNAQSIPEEKQAHLFDIFFQIDASSTRAYEGMGMGLAVAKMFTEGMGGQIGVKSIENKGNMFWFKMPMQVLK